MSPVDRIRALRRLAESTTYPEEAASASAKAKELQAKYGVSDAALEPPTAPMPMRPVVPGYGVQVIIIWSGIASGAGPGFTIRFQ